MRVTSIVVFMYLKNIFYKLLKLLCYSYESIAHIDSVLACSDTSYRRFGSLSSERIHSLKNWFADFATRWLVIRTGSLHDSYRF